TQSLLERVFERLFVLIRQARIGRCHCAVSAHHRSLNSLRARASKDCTATGVTPNMPAISSTENPSPYFHSSTRAYLSGMELSVFATAWLCAARSNSFGGSWSEGTHSSSSLSRAAPSASELS